ncbi:MAG: ABC transporter substrate-binding protein [Pseudomonadota bacterium]
MRGLVLSLVLSLTATFGTAFEVEDQLRLGPEDAASTLRIISTADAEIFQSVLEGFLAETPDLAIDYVVASSTELMRALTEDAAPFDVAISSAMDLQTKLANDRLTLPHSSNLTSSLPDWARWRQDLFSFTQEPAAIVLSRAAFDGLEMPQTREDLIAILRQHPDRFRGRVGTYDLRQSGLGYLFATQDSRTSEVFWRLTEVMGSLDAALYCCSAAMIDDVASGKLAVAYNALSSYALSREDTENYEVIFPADFTTVMMRTALIPATATNTPAASEFIDHLLRVAWGPGTSPAISGLSVDTGPFENSVRRIRVGPGLLIFLDEFKRSRFIEAWENAILQD